MLGTDLSCRIQNGMTCAVPTWQISVGCKVCWIALDVVECATRRIASDEDVGKGRMK